MADTTTGLLVKTKSGEFVSVIAGSGATDFLKLEDAAAANGDAGIQVLAVRKDTAGAGIGADGDYTPLSTDATGLLRVTRGTEYAEDAASAGGELMTLAGAVRQDSISSLTSADGDYAYLKVDATGRLYVNAANVTTYAEDAASAGGETLMLAGAIRQDTVASSTSADGDFSNLKVDSLGRLYVDISGVNGATQSAANPLFVRLTDGTTAYVAGSNAPNSPKVSTVTSASLGAGASVDLNHAAITDATTGKLAGVDVGSTVPLKIEIKTVAAGTPTTRVVLFAQPFVGVIWRSPHSAYITQAGNVGGTSIFRTTVTNLDATAAADVYATAFWDE